MNEALAAGQQWRADTYAKNARFVADLGQPVVEWLAPVAGERVLDLGCGDGALTEKLVALGCRVVGVDAAPDMVGAAKARGLDARVMSGTQLLFADEFDAVFSNAVLHWIKDADAVIAGVAQSLRKGGRFVGEFGGFGNVVACRTALRAVMLARGVDPAPLDPWYFPTADAYAARLAKGGFRVDRIELIHRPTLLPTGLAGWIETFGAAFLSALPAGERAAAVAEAERLLAPLLRDEQGRWFADYVRLRFAAAKP
ncbi:class I SAM-dependent methyltransferase [Desertibaculum subflavum]|uniref:class I SAM-dependent methyltransferase n=1 Tax=Desertibaculum subflavum TaxID=2268458 RepID=UPI000E664222